MLGFCWRVRDIQPSVSLRRAIRAGEIDSPAVAVRVEGQGLERYGHLRGPPFLVNPGLCAPDAHPVEICLGGISVDRLGTHAVGIQLKQVAVAPVEKRVEDHAEVIVIVDTGTLAKNLGGDFPGRAVQETRPDVKVGIVVEHEYEHRLGGFFVFVRVDLVKVVNRHGSTPDLFIQDTVDDGRRVRANDPHRLFRGRASGLRNRGRIQARQANGREQDPD